ncbi:MAG TPA: lecithin retinol acyltransferase family protein [Oscillatoriales cyanobacterium M59_W2019_021]|nr:lecithin retinol acyltransferase family protein [Oscillatoriales cyanobacterium M4454_W2019_049]HIK52731.1 lecithin retinol acyltransferase family protein [Oscillatoriales cyanobacterium M59_W2019_021]
MGRGDQIYVMREWMALQGVYEHHGIDCGDGTVIHYRKPSETIERTSMETFTRGGKIYICHHEVCYIAETVVMRAESRLGERKYNLLYNNCEHFATWCKTGTSYSTQITNFIPIIKHLNPDALSDPIENAILDAKPKDSSILLNEALAEIKVAWNDIQPQYNQAVRDLNEWQRVAELALRKNREDLAREALYKKLNYKQKAIELKSHLDKLAQMTETLLKDAKVL